MRMHPDFEQAMAERRREAVENKAAADAVAALRQVEGRRRAHVLCQVLNELGMVILGPDGPGGTVMRREDWEARG